MKSIRNTLLLAAVAAAGLAAVGAASANVVNIQFEVTNGNHTASSFSGTQGAYTGDSLTAPTWNVLPVLANATSGSMSNLVASDNTATTDAVSFTAGGGYVSPPTSPTNNLTQSFILNTSSTPDTVTLTGLASNGNYQLYLYGSNGDWDNSHTTFSITTGNGSPAAGSNAATVSGTPPDQNNAIFVENADYVVFNATANSSGTLGISYVGTNNPGEGDFNGLQLISSSAVPEPASLGLVALGGLGLLLIRRRRTA